MTKLLVPCFLGILSLFIFACTPKVEVAAPSEPITINLNVKIQHEILVKVDKELDNLFKEEKGLF
ncbi:MAG: YnbE family lipoprotein [Candidatus Electrothrix sp. AUS4]|uniref:YnbE family lipoprotein n=1 Tax=Candidatus Electrothrix aestuarii TaxID=3062594 RepID=A0AAU8LWX5_9BACT|nr:YnbE family lipoprotein [Candidatus Electrothrix sp. AUS4]MDU9043902.1 YnbE family lipoprotein [Candidatus Electrothrix aestuarii]